MYVMQVANSLQLLLALLFISIISKATAGALYDSTAYTECVESPKAPLYSGGILLNPKFDKGIEGWLGLGCKVQLAEEEKSKNTYLLATDRSSVSHGPAHIFPLKTGFKYSLSAWVQVNGGQNATSLVKASVLANGKYYSCAGTVIAKRGCWSFLKGGFDSDITTSSAHIVFQSKDPHSEIWIDNISIQPFSTEEWTQHREESTNNTRKQYVRVTVVDSRGNGVHGVFIRINQLKMEFSLGSAIPADILDNLDYQRWFLERFNTAVFENELKWYYTEPQPRNVSYTIADELLAFCKQNKVAVRGHNIFWEDPNFTPSWVRNLETLELKKAVLSRIRSLMGHYRGKFLQWDVDNEMLHFSFFDRKLGTNTSDEFYECAQKMDPKTPLYMNEFNVIETCEDEASTPDAYIQRLYEIESMGKVMEGIGLESHFSNKPNIAYMRATLDKMGALNLPIWLTELDVKNITGQAHYLDEVLREAFSHASVQGIVFWAAIHPNGCWRMCLTDNKFTNLATGNVVDAFLDEYLIKAKEGRTDSKGSFKFQGLHGQYQLSVVTKNRHITRKFVVKSSQTQTQVVLVQL